MCDGFLEHSWSELGWQLDSQDSVMETQGGEFEGNKSTRRMQEEFVDEATQRRRLAVAAKTSA